MICENVIGTIKDDRFQNKAIDYVDIEWYEAFKKLHKKSTRCKKEIGIRLGNDILTKGLKQDDVLYEDGDNIIAVNIRPCQMILVDIHENHPHMLGKVCYEIGNKHAALFWGKDHTRVMTPYNQPTLEQLQKIHGISCNVETVKPDFSRSISSSINEHTH